MRGRFANFMVALFLSATQVWAVDGFIPAATTATAATFQLRILGTGFVAGETFRFQPPGGAPVNLTGETFINSGEYRVMIPANLLTAAGTAFVIEVDVGGSPVYEGVAFTINPVPQITVPGGGLPTGTGGAPYSYQNTYTGGTAPVAWTIVSGALPAGLQMNSAGVISGTPSGSGTANFGVRLTDNAGVVDEESLQITVQSGGPLFISSGSPLIPGKRGVPYSQPLIAGGGMPPYTWSITGGAAPAGLTLAATGILSGTPTATGDAQFTARVTDSAMATSSKSFAISIALPVVSCAIAPRNSSLSGHKPTNHLGVMPLFPNHRFSVTVTAEESPVSATNVLVTASLAAFSATNGLPNLTTVNGTTNASGVASFTINPQADMQYVQTDLTASGEALGLPFRCMGSVTTGMGTLSGPIEVLSGGSSAAAFLVRLQDDVQAFFFKYEREMEALLEEDQTLARRLDKFLERYSPMMLDLRAGKAPATARAEDLDEAEWILKRIEAGVGREAGAATAELRERLAGSPARDALSARKAQRKSPAPARTEVATSSAERDARIAADYGKLPLAFEENRGQLGAGVRYIARSRGRSVFLTARQAVLVDQGSAALATAPVEVPIEFVGANQNAMFRGEEKLLSESHDLRGNDPAQWRTGIPHYGRVRYSAVYPGIDLVFHGEQRKLEFDFVVAPGADPDRIRLRFAGAEKVEVEANGALSIQHRQGSLRLERPVIYQEIGGERKETGGRFVAGRDSQVRFEVARYDRSLPLIIDPVVVYSSYVGGSGDDGAAQIAVDAQGNAYITGGTLSTNFPFTTNLKAGSAEVDVFVTKLNSTGTQIVYSTLVGGSGQDSGMGIAVDAFGNAYVTGITRSPNFPKVLAAQQKCPSGSQPDASDTFVFKLNPQGSGLTYSTCLGGTGMETGRAIAVGTDGSAYVTGFTTSTNFPLANAHQGARGGSDPSSALDFLGADAFVTKLNAGGTSLMYSTYLGGSGGDMGMAIALDGTARAYVTGVTYSENFPLVNPLQQTKKGPSDVFVSRFGAFAGELQYSTYFGGTSDDMGMALALDGSGNVYIGGTTGSPDFPVMNAAQSQFGGVNQVGLDAFVTKLTLNGTAIGYSTFVGGSGADSGMALAVASDGSAYLVGETYSPDFPTVGFPKPLGDPEAFLVKVNAQGSAFDFGGVLGGFENEVLTGVAVDPLGNVLVAGISSSTDFPVTENAAQRNSGSDGDAMVLKISGASAPVLVRTVSSANLVDGEVAPASIATGFAGGGMATSTAQAQPAALVLGGATMTVKDRFGVERPVSMYYASPIQINYIMPDGTANGVAEVSVKVGGQVVARGSVRIFTVIPGLYAANANGIGTAAAVSTTIEIGGAQTLRLTFSCGVAPLSCIGTPIVVGDGSRPVYISLYGTGIKKRSSLAAVTVKVGGVNVPVQYAGAQSEFDGLDQVNIGPLPVALAGSGVVQVDLTADGVPALPVTITIQ